MNFKNLWNNFFQILEGVSNNINKKEDVEKIAKKRLEICSKCEHQDKTGEQCLVPGTQPCCGICGCKLAFKTRSLSSECPHPDKKWKAVMSVEKEDELYNKLGYEPDGENN